MLEGQGDEGLETVGAVLQATQAGEMLDLSRPPAGRFQSNGLQWHGWLCLDDQSWVYVKNDKPPHPPRFTDEALREFVGACRTHQAPVTFNVIIFQDGSIAEASIDQLRRMRN